MFHQSGILGIGTTDHSFIEFNLRQPSAEAIAAIVEAVNLPTTAGANVVVGFKPSLWAQFAEAKDIPDNVHDFDEAIQGPDGFSMPATQCDGWLWVHASTRSQAFDVLKHLLKTLGGVLELKTETTGWVYESNRDLTGFEDGTENPGLLEAPSVIAIPDGEPGAGSSVLLFQLWKHKSRAWEALPVEEQELAMGRTKDESEELDEEIMPDSSHVSRTVVEVDGEELEIYRRNVAYGDHREHGTVFVGFSFDQWRTEEMLRRMAGADGGPRDEITRFTEPVSGAWYVCPSIDALVKFLD
ncbi:Dyp-type peroxidase [Corynebacterium gerontici]|uniref:Putative deferrochelatase/peroxidase YfeX n=1 Tax=Corynebacterium gerontici TaxID=2079234 RepID=A0A3G6IYL3_9CORY|nr:Dyp-type peroxidase [Corynebacterium gerontici]AZA10583.1 putative deferrochelatase/peroxidase YfeX [Corynebacterium gerontici]